MMRRRTIDGGRVALAHRAPVDLGQGLAGRVLSFDQSRTGLGGTTNLGQDEEAAKEEGDHLEALGDKDAGADACCRAEAERVERHVGLRKVSGCRSGRWDRWIGQHITEQGFLRRPVG
jgi:hypothetical protein